ncbi:MAG: cytochrome c [Actinomycetes bacterium]
MLHSKIGRRTGLVLVTALTAAFLAPTAFSATPKVVGNATAGKAGFIANCGLCHALKAAKSMGAIGPDLDKVPLTQAVLIKAIASGGTSVMTKAAAAKYSVPMQAYKGTLSTTQINDISAYIYTSTHK